jgi:hypothetical protein
MDEAQGSGMDDAETAGVSSHNKAYISAKEFARRLTREVEEE